MTSPSGSDIATGRALVSGNARGAVLRLDAPISFWGGVDPVTGRIQDARHPQAGATLTGRMLLVPETVGSSSSSAIMMELMRNGHAPAGLVLGIVDAILVLGVIVGREMGYPPLPVLLLEGKTFDRLGSDGIGEIRDGRLVICRSDDPSDRTLT